MIDHSEFFPQGLKPLSVRVNSSSFKKSWQPSDYGVPIHVNREIGSTGSFKLLSDEYGLSFRRLRDGLYNALSNHGLRIGNHLWLIPEGQSWDRSMTALKKYQAEFRDLKRKLRVRYPKAIEEYAAEVDAKMPGVGDLVREKAYPWAYLEQRLNIIVQTSFHESARSGAYDELIKRIDFALSKLEKGGEYRASKFTREHLEAIIDWSASMSIFEPSLGLIGKLVSAALTNLPEKVGPSKCHLAVSLEIANVLIEAKSTVLSMCEHAEADDANRSDVVMTTLLNEEELPPSSSSTDVSSDDEQLANESDPLFSALLNKEQSTDGNASAEVSSDDEDLANEADVLFSMFGSV
ncbi:DUF3150 domain-containing protein [Vibrio sp. PNB22_3_1]